MFATYPGDQVLRPQAAEWVQRTIIKCRPVEHTGGGKHKLAWIERWRCEHENISEVVYYRRSDTPIDMVRNHSVAVAKELGVDYLLMIDSDMEPDQEGPRAKLFWEVAFPFLFDRKSPALIFAPYLHGLEGFNNVCVFKWMGWNNHAPKESFQAQPYDRQQAAQMAGIEKVAMGPTGLMLIDMRVFDHVAEPYFQYEWEGDGLCCPACGQQEPGPRTHKATTEDCYFTREVTDALCEDPDAGCFCAWDCWAKHIKICDIPRPDPICFDHVGRAYRKAVEMRRNSNEGVQIVARDPKLPPAKNRTHSLAEDASELRHVLNQFEHASDG